MEAVVSAIAGEVLSRIISFTVAKYARRNSCLDEKLERLQRLLLRVHTVVEEADARCITNSGMLVQLKNLTDGMYRGYFLLDSFKCRQRDPQMVRRSDDQAVLIRSVLFNNESPDDLEIVLGNLESTLANMTEFVLLLAGCEKRVSRGPYDTYLYIDSFMFGRAVEKQQLINVLLQDGASPLGEAPTVVPIIGGRLVGKKTLVAHACGDERVRSRFSSVLHLDADDIRRKKLWSSTRAARSTLTVVELVSDVDDECWAEFCSSAARGSKVVIVSRLERVARFGTVKPIRLDSLSNEEFVYLFKALAFGSANPGDHPQLACIGLEIARSLRGLLLSGNVVADMLRKNLSVQYWLRILKRYRTVVQRNFSEFGEHPKLLIEKDRPVDITRFATSSSVHHASSLRIMPSRGVKGGVMRKKERSFGDLIAGSRCATVLPNQQDFEIVIWESRLPPYTTFVATCAEQKDPYSPPSSKKRRGGFDT